MMIQVPDNRDNRHAGGYYRPCDLSPGYSDCGMGELRIFLV